MVHSSEDPLFRSLRAPDPLEPPVPLEETREISRSPPTSSGRGALRRLGGCLWEFLLVCQENKAKK